MITFSDEQAASSPAFLMTSTGKLNTPEAAAPTTVVFFTTRKDAIIRGKQQLHLPRNTVPPAPPARNRPVRYPIRARRLRATKLVSGGALTGLLAELEESGFVSHRPAFGKHSEDVVHYLADEYSLFYLRWIERHRTASDGVWITKRGSPAWRAWSGLAFESVCLKHFRVAWRPGSP